MVNGSRIMEAMRKHKKHKKNQNYIIEMKNVFGESKS